VITITKSHRQTEGVVPRPGYHTHEASHVLILLNFQLSVGTFWTLLLCICNTSCHVCTTVCSHMYIIFLYTGYRVYHVPHSIFFYKN